MKRLLFLILLLCCYTITLNALILEPYDKVLKCKYYTSFYSYKIKAPSFVIYKLYKGGGKIKRTGLTFTGTYPHYNYIHSGYDKGHLANAEDFANDSTALYYTFNYVNAIPQYTTLNRGKWKSLETYVRKLSQKQHLIIICGGVDYKGLIPDKCFKIVYNNKGKLLCYWIYTNDVNSIQTKLNTNFLNNFTYKKVILLLSSKPDVIIKMY